METRTAKGLKVGAVVLVLGAAGGMLLTMSGRGREGPTEGQKAAAALPATDDAWVTATNLYQIFPAKFTPAGTIPAMTGRLPYLKELGIKTIWLMPVFTAMSEHGYNTIDYRTVSPKYGTNEDLRDFVSAAHAADIRVLLDLVLNHTGSYHSWFSGDDSQRHDDWYIWSNEDRKWNDPWVQNDDPQAGKTWFKDPKAELDRDHNGKAHDDDYFYCVFCDTAPNGQATTDMPDLNWKAALQAVESGQQSPLFNEVEDIMRYWVTYAGVDGFRADAARYLVENGKPSLNRDQPETHRVWQELHRRLAKISPAAVLVAEAPTETYDEMIAYYGSVEHREFQGAFHFKYYGTLMDTIKNGRRTGELFSGLDAIQSHLPYDQTRQRLLAQDFVFLSNHDSFTGSRVAEQLGGDVARIKLAASIYLLLSGNPVIYYGEEYGMRNKPGASGDDAVRGPMDWDEVARQKREPSSVYSHYEGLLRIRNRYDALRGGRSLAVPSKGDGEASFDGPASNSGRVALMREYYGEKILVLTNLTNRAQSLRLDLGGAGLPTVGEGEVHALVGCGSSESVTAGNLRNYPVGEVAAYSTRVLFLGPLPARYQPLLSYEKAGCVGPGPGPDPMAYFRGTPNNWGTTAMDKSSGRWRTTQTFGGDNPRFKISIGPTWDKAFPSSDYQITQGPGDYEITFDEASKAIDVHKLWQAAYFRGTPNEWGTTAMNKDGNQPRLWKISQTFGGANPRFKITPKPDWTESYPASDYPIQGGPGSYNITFDEMTKTISVNKVP